MHSSFLDAIVNYIHGDGITVLPQMELLLFALGILIFDFLLEKKEKHWNAGLALLGVAASAFGLFMQAKRFNLQRESRSDLPGLLGFQNTVVVDGYSLFFAAIFLAATALVILLSVRYLDLEREQEGEYYALLLLACIGMMFMASGTDLVVMFLGLETMALSFYVLTGYRRREKRSNEAALKYLLLGGFSTGILAYGFSLLYGLTGSTSIWDIGTTLDRRFQFVAARGMADWLGILAFVTLLLASSLRSQPSHSISGHPTSMRARPHPSRLTSAWPLKRPASRCSSASSSGSSLARNPCGKALSLVSRSLHSPGAILRPLRRPTSSASSLTLPSLTSATFFSASSPATKPASRESSTT